MGLKWRYPVRQKKEDRRIADCGIFEVEVDHDEDAGWLYDIEVCCSKAREYGDRGYMNGFRTREEAQRAAESWLLKQVKHMQRDLGGK